MKMKKSVFILLVSVMVIYLIGCGKKQQSLEQAQEPISMEELSKLTIGSQAMPETKTQEIQSTPQVVEKLELPSAQEIQTALKNAGYYAGAIDGKIGPLSKKAIEEFQQANGLQVDGKVGPKTWAVLGAYLNPAPAVESKKR